MMKTQSFAFVAVVACLALPRISLAAPEHVTQIVLQEQQKKAIAEKLADQADKYAGEGKYTGQGAWTLDAIKADLKAGLERTEKWVKSHLTFHFHATKTAATAAAPAAAAAQAEAPVVAPAAPAADAPEVVAMTGPVSAAAAQAEASHENNVAATQAYFESRKQAVDNYTDAQQVIEAHQQAVQDVAKSGNYLFAVTNHSVAFDGTFIDSMVLILTTVTDLALLPLEFLASLFTGF